MKPDWDKLMEEFKDSTTTLVADVDCTSTDGQKLCSQHGIQGYPTIKHGDPADLEDYQGGRDFDSLQKFAKSLKPSCSPFNIDLCDDEQKEKIEGLMALSDDDLKAKIDTEEGKIKDAEKTFKSEVEKLQKKYESLSKDKEKAIKDVKDSGLGLMKAVSVKKSKDAESSSDEEL